MVGWVIWLIALIESNGEELKAARRETLEGIEVEEVEQEQAKSTTETKVKARSLQSGKSIEISACGA